MAPRSLRLIVRTPHTVVVEMEAYSLRVLTESGQAGLRPGAEPAVFAIEPGLALARTADGMRIIGTAGGLLLWNSDSGTLLTPLAIVGTNRSELEKKLAAQLAEPSEEMQARTQLGQLENRILDQIGRERVHTQNKKQRQ